MNHQTILTKAIEKARIGGWDGPSYEDYMHFDSIRLNDIIYSHDFAKALWPEKTEPCAYCGLKVAWGSIHPLPCPYSFMESRASPWRYHLQQMVIADDPIKYLGENI